MQARKVKLMVSDASRRFHGADIVAEVAADGHGAWSAKVWLASNPGAILTLARSATNLWSAQAKADSLARRAFDHCCGAACGRWTWNPE